MTTPSPFVLSEVEGRIVRLNSVRPERSRSAATVSAWPSTALRPNGRWAFEANPSTSLRTNGFGERGE